MGTVGILEVMVPGDREERSGKEGVPGLYDIQPRGVGKQKRKGCTLHLGHRKLVSGVECPCCPAGVWNLTGRWLHGRAPSPQGASALPAVQPKGRPAGSTANRTPSCAPQAWRTVDSTRTRRAAPCPPPTSLNQMRAPDFVPSARTGRLDSSFPLFLTTGNKRIGKFLLWKNNRSMSFVA